MIGKQTINFILKGGKIYSHVNKLSVVGIRDAYISRIDGGKIYGVKTIKLEGNNHNGEFKNFSGHNPLVKIFPDLENIVLMDLYHPSDIQWVNNYKYKILISNEYPNINNLMSYVNKSLIDINEDLPQIDFKMDFQLRH
jgi:hypothetical protein